jgi:hypothetical protein
MLDKQEPHEEDEAEDRIIDILAGKCRVDLFLLTF